MATTTARLTSTRAALSTGEWGRVAAMGVVIVAMNVAGWGIFAFAILPHHFHYKGLGIGAGVALTA